MPEDSTVPKESEKNEITTINKITVPIVDLNDRILSYFSTIVTNLKFSHIFRHLPVFKIRLFPTPIPPLTHTSIIVFSLTLRGEQELDQNKTFSESDHISPSVSIIHDRGIWIQFRCK